MQIITVLILCATTMALAQNAAQVAVVNGNNNFGMKLYQKVVAKEEGNVLLSPYSAETVLAMLSIGANGQTFTEIVEGLSLPADKGIIKNGFKPQIDGLQKVGTVNLTLETANKLYIEKTFEIYTNYQNDLVNYFYSTIEETDFMNNPEGSRISINNWVQSVTKDKIKDLLPKDSVMSDTVLVLVNALYFKGKWIKPFNKNDTKSDLFYTSSNAYTNVQMMHITDTFRYVEMESYKALELPYAGNKISMIIILPNERTGLKNLENNLQSINLTIINQTMQSQMVKVSLPKFNIENNIPMNEYLKDLGMVQMFTDVANFSDISKTPVKVSTVVQKTFIEVSEEGTEAAAATAITGVIITSVGVDPPIRMFEADHPFIYYLWDRSTGAILFLGRLQNPE